MENSNQTGLRSKNHHQANPSVYIIFLASLLILFSGCGSTSVQQPGSVTGNDIVATSSVTEDVSVQTFTLEELAKFDGKDNNKAYIAIDGIVYDVTALSQWGSRLHAGKFVAGKDYTEELKNAPHTIEKLAEALKIGTLIQP